MFFPMCYSQNNEFHIITSSSFNEIRGSGNSFDEAMIGFWEALYDTLNYLIDNNKNIPKHFKTKKDVNKIETTSSFKITPNVSLKILIHELMLEKKISRIQLAKLLPIDVDELLNVRHHSTIWEFEQALRELNYFLDFDIIPINNE